ncbi:hypothetical protein [Streptomyces sp. NPDC090025]|uniref:hypothetical protein n=1 Tax=Streptomyces sp. NPDC090025 TaxID=3365922 RepID=UPI003837B90C
MLDTPEAVFEALRENHDRPHGLHRTVTGEELVEAAEVLDQADVLVTALLELMTAYEFTGEHRKSPVVFARLLKLWDDKPESFSEWEAHQVFWRFKWVTTSLLQVPEVPLASVRGWTERMRERYESARHEMQPVAAMRFHVAAHIGAGADDAFDLWVTRPRTELSDCEACETRSMAAHLVTSGDDTAALDRWQPVLDGAQSCSEEPQMSQARALLPLLRTGRLDEARSHHLTGYRKVRGNTGMQHEVGLHLEFCALSRNEGRGLEILAENRALFDADGAPLDRLGFLTGVEVLVARLVAEGHGDTAVAGPPGRNWTADTLLAHARAEAGRLAAAFDARNGTTAVGDRRRARLERAPLLDTALPLGLRATFARSAAPATAATTAAAPAAGVAEAADRPVVTVPEDFTALVREARRRSSEGRPVESRLWTLVEERHATEPYDEALGPRELFDAELALHRAAEFGNAERRAEFVAEVDRAAELYTAVGMEWHALSARTRGLAFGPWLGDSDEDTATATADDGADDGAGTEVRAMTVAEARAALDAVLDEAAVLREKAPFTDTAPSAGETASAVDGHGVGAARAQEYVKVLNSVAYAAYRELLTELPEAAEETVARFDRAVSALRAEAGALAMPHQVASARQFVADVAGRRGDLAMAEAELWASLADVAAAGRPWRGSRARCLLAQFLIGADRPDEALELLHQAIADAVRYDDRDFPMAPTYALLGHAASHAGDAAGAVRHLSEAAARFDQAGEAAEAASVRLQLTDVLSESGRPEDAVAVLESVLGDGSADLLDDRVLAQARLSLGRGLRDLGEFLPAAEEFLRLADLVSGWPVEDRAVLTLVATDAAITLALADRWDAAGTAYDRALAAHAEAPNTPRTVHMAREFARLVMVERGAEGVAEALAHLDRGDELLAAASADDEAFALWYEVGSVEYRRGRVLAEAERFPEALTAMEAAIATHGRGGADGELPRAEAVRMAALIEANGLELRDAAIARLVPEAARCRAAGHEEAAAILDQLRADLQEA